MKHTRNRRAFAPRPFPISLTSLRREVANRHIQQRTLSPGYPGNLFRGLPALKALRLVCQFFAHLYRWALCYSFTTATDTRSNAPARRDEDRVIRPLVCCRQCRLRVVRFRAGAKARSLRCISSSGKIIRFCRSPIMAYFPRAISSFGAGIQLLTSIRHIERAAPVNNRPYRVCYSTTMPPS